MNLPRKNMGWSRPVWTIRPASATFTLAALLLATTLLAALSSGCAISGHRATSYGWPGTSNVPVTPLQHPLVEKGFADIAGMPGAEPPATSYAFAVFGDQRALADGEWQELLARIAAVDAELRAAPAAAPDGLAFILDTGDIVNDGELSDQFDRLRGILTPVAHLPYLVAVGNHELDNNKDPRARVNTTRFLSYLDAGFGADRMWYRKDLGAARFLFLDTNDLVYGETGERKECPQTIDPDSRSGRQLDWLLEQLTEPGESTEPAACTIVALHHPPVQSSEKHRDAGRSLWNARFRGRQLPDLLADGGVDVILTGHTHTYERFTLTRADGRTLALVNFSGRPRNSSYGTGAGARRARDIRGRENKFLAEAGWLGLEGWQVTQDELLLERDEANQFGLVTVAPDGAVRLQVCYLDEDAPDGLRRTPVARLH